MSTATTIVTNVIPFARPAVAPLDDSSTSGRHVLPLAAGLARIVEAHVHVSPTTRAAALMAFAVRLLRDEHVDLAPAIARVLLNEVVAAGAERCAEVGADDVARGPCQAVSPSPTEVSGAVVAASTPRTT